MKKLEEKVKKQLEKMDVSFYRVVQMASADKVVVQLLSDVRYDVVRLMVLKQMVGAEKMEMEMVYDYDSSFLSLVLDFNA